MWHGYPIGQVVLVFFRFYKSFAPWRWVAAAGGKRDGLVVQLLEKGEPGKKAQK